jgi:hypothetical protein
MENLQIEATKSSPKIDFNKDTYVLGITGESFPENTTQFYEPIIKWIDECLDTVENENIIVNIELIYFNSSSSKVIMDMFDTFEDASDEGKNIVVNWIYDEDNEAALEYGEEFAEDLESLTFNLVEQ